MPEAKKISKDRARSLLGTNRKVVFMGNIGHLTKEVVVKYKDRGGEEKHVVCFSFKPEIKKSESSPDEIPVQAEDVFLISK